VALAQTLAVYMVLSAGIRLSAFRACSLAFGLLLIQALPLIKIEGIAYLAEHLVAALVMPGGFGSADDADYWRDTADTFREFGRFTIEATGGVWFAAGVAVAGSAFAIVSRMRTRGRSRVLLAFPATCAAVTSFLVSYRFFQEELKWSLRTAAFAISPGDPDPGAGWLVRAVDTLMEALAAAAFRAGDLLYGPPLLGSVPWLKLAIPELAMLAAATILFWRDRYRLAEGP
jgi:hypothetical protein